MAVIGAIFLLLIVIAFIRPLLKFVLWSIIISVGIWLLIKYTTEVLTTVSAIVLILGLLIYWMDKKETNELMTECTTLIKREDIDGLENVFFKGDNSKRRKFIQLVIPQLKTEDVKNLVCLNMYLRFMKKNESEKNKIIFDELDGDSYLKNTWGSLSEKYLSSSFSIIQDPWFTQIFNIRKQDITNNETKEITTLIFLEDKNSTEELFENSIDLDD